MTPGLSSRRGTDFIVIHCSASPPSPDTDVKTIDRWHRQRGFLMVGYHYVIKTDGTIQPGRPHHTVGAHVAGHNARSIGVCMVGGVDSNLKATNNFTDDQFLSLLTVLKDLRKEYPQARILGHRDFPGVVKDCPSFDVRVWASPLGL